MSDISIIGLGSMGAALAHAFQQAGHKITIWNRTPEKLRLLISSGAKGAPSVADAVQASPAILVCLDSYVTTRRLLGAADVALHLAGRTLIQLGTGTPREARESEAWLKANGCKYLDGAILAGPGDIGAKNARILFSGAQAVFEQCEPRLKCLGGDRRYLGEDVGAAAALDLAWLSACYGAILGAVHGARLCESEQLSVGLYASLFADNPYMQAARKISENAYTNPGATLAVWEGALRRLQSQANDAGINSEIPDFASGLFKRAVMAGYGGEDAAALIKVLRSGSTAKGRRQ